MSRNSIYNSHQEKQTNDPKKNKQKMILRANSKITEREMDNSNIKNTMSIDRIMLERQMTTHNFDTGDDTYIGDITGEKIDEIDDIKGMPVRSSYTVKKSKYDNNDHLDFDLYQKIDKRKNDNIKYIETQDDSYTDIDDAMKSITEGSDPFETCISNINSVSCWMNSNMFSCSKDDYTVNGFGLFSAFGAIYMISRGNTEIELKNYFNFQDKKHLNAGLLTIHEELNKNREQFIIDNYLLNDMNIPNNINTSKKLKPIIKNIIFNKEMSEKESFRINQIIESISTMKNVVSPATISKSEISIISVARICPIWSYKIDNIIKNRFYGKLNDTSLVEYIRFVGKTFYYYEDPDKQVIEIPIKDDTYKIGMIMNKNNKDSSTNLKSLSVSINYLKPTVLDEVLIPVINKRYKTRYNKTLQKTGLNVLFEQEQEMNGLFPEGGNFSDCVQYIDLIFKIQSENKKSNNVGYRTTRKFIANKDFEYYLRNIKNNCILIMGRI